MIFISFAYFEGLGLFSVACQSSQHSGDSKLDDMEIWPVLGKAFVEQTTF